MVNFMTLEILRATEDASINIVESQSEGGFIESRFVQRHADTVILYLSSANGCNLSCRMCHLTQTGQTLTTHVTVDGYLTQAENLFSLMVDENKLKDVTTVHYNFMARGDALNNPFFLTDTADIIQGLDNLSWLHNLKSKFKISTIFPRNIAFEDDMKHFKSWVEDTLSLHPELEFYYSLYSLKHSFRKRWLPKAMSPDLVGEVFQGTVDKLILHHALIDQENADFENILDINNWLLQHDIKTRFNIVRYNPYDSTCGREADDATTELYRQKMEALSNITLSSIVSRVGNSVKASCGTFVE